MTRKPKAYIAALPLSALPEWKEWLAPFLGTGGTRGNVVMVRLGDDHLRRLDQLVEAGLFASRSEAAAFLVGAGIRAQRELFARIGRHSREMSKLRQVMRNTALKALRSASRNPRRSPTPRKR